MCHLCRKVERVQGLDSKVTRPILVAISKLHRIIEPRLGELWLRRHTETTRLRSLLSQLHRVVPIKALGAILEEVDQELVHIEKNMAEHSTAKEDERTNVLTTSVTPEESSSVRMGNEIRLEKQRREHDRKGRGAAKHTGDGSRRGPFKSPLGKALSDFSGSDIDPPPVRIQHSTRIVERWIWKNDELIDAYNQHEAGNRSMISVIGGVLERPIIDVGIWKNSSNLRQSNMSSSIAGKTGPKHQFRQAVNASLHRKQAEITGIGEKKSGTTSIQLTQASYREKKTKQSVSKGGVPMDAPSYKPSLPIAIGRPLSPTTTQDIRQLREDDALTSGNIGAQAAPTRKRLEGELPTKSPYLKSSQPRNYDTPDPSQNASRRRIERRSPAKTGKKNPEGKRSSPPPSMPDRTKTHIFAVNLDPEYAQEKQPKEPKYLDRAGGQPRGKIEPEYLQNRGPEISDAVKNSRRRRAERVSVPLNDRYRNEERRKAWAPTK